MESVFFTVAAKLICIKSSSLIAQAIRAWDRAIELDNGERRDRFRIARAYALTDFKEHAPAMSEVSELAQGKMLASGATYDLACIASLASVAAAEDVRLRKTKRIKLAEQYVVRAIELLRQAKDAGYFKDAAQVAHMKEDSDLDPLRARPDYQKLLAEVEAEAKPAAK
jgi:hypothetical protein